MTRALLASLALHLLVLAGWAYVSSSRGAVERRAGSALRGPLTRVRLFGRSAGSPEANAAATRLERPAGAARRRTATAGAFTVESGRVPQALAAATEALAQPEGRPPAGDLVAAGAAAAEVEGAAFGPPVPGVPGESVQGVAAEATASGEPSGRGGLGGSGAPGESGGAGARRGAGRDLAELHARLATSAQRCYPPAARRYRLTGEVSVWFCLDASGALASLSLRGTAGSALLDRAAEGCVVQGALPLPLAPGCYVVPVRFAER